MMARLRLLLLVAALAFDVPCQDPEIVHHVVGPLSEYNYGQMGVVGLGDVNGDSIADYAASSIPPIFPSSEVIQAHSGASGAVLWQRSLFVAHMAGGGDVNGDGSRDLITVRYSGWNNEVDILSGRDGSLIRRHSLLGTSIRYSWPGLIFGDADGDGFDDYLLCQLQTSTPTTGIVTAHSGRTGQFLYQLSGPSSTLRDWVTPLGDIDDDDVSDFAIAQASCTGQVGQSCSGSIAVYSGRWGNQLYQISGLLLGNMRFGGPHAGGGDMNGDGVPDFLSLQYYPPGAHHRPFWDRWFSDLGPGCGFWLHRELHWYGGRLEWRRPRRCRRVGHVTSRLGYLVGSGWRDTGILPAADKLVAVELRSWAQPFSVRGC